MGQGAVLGSIGLPLALVKARQSSLRCQPRARPVSLPVPTPLVGQGAVLGSIGLPLALVKVSQPPTCRPRARPASLPTPTLYHGARRCSWWYRTATDPGESKPAPPCTDPEPVVSLPARYSIVGQGVILGGIGLPLVLVKASQPRLCTDPEPVWCRYQCLYPIVGQGAVFGSIEPPLVLVKASQPSPPRANPEPVRRRRQRPHPIVG